MFGTGRIYTKKVTIDGITFDSEMEALYYKELKERESSGEVENIKVHTPYVLVHAYINANGRKHKEITYEPDFIFFDKKLGTSRFIDVKGMLTDDFKIKWKMFDLILRQDGHYLEVLKYSKTTGWVDFDQYKKAMKTKRQELIAQKNEYKKEAEKLAKGNEKLKKEFARYYELKGKSKLTSTETERLRMLQIKLKDYIG